MTRKLAIWLKWQNFSEYHSRQLGAVLEPEYETTVTYRPLDWSEFDVVMPFFPGGDRNPDCPREKIVKFVWEPHEFGWARDAGIVCAASSSVYERIAPRYGERARLLPWGVNPAHFQPQPWPQSDTLRVGWCGQWKNPRKQYAKLGELVQSIPSAEWCPNMTEMVKGKGQHGAYTMETMHQYYASIHVYACASSSEGFCFPLLEATACGRPVVTFDVGVARDLKASGAGVVVVDDWDLMRAFLKVMTANDCLTLGSLSTRATAQAWTWCKLKERWLEVLNSAGT